MPFFAIGVDLGGTNLRIAAVDQYGKQLETITTGTELNRGRDTVIELMCRDIKALENKFAAQYAFAGSGIGIPGIIDLESGTLHESPNLPGWDNYPVRDAIEQRLDASVFLENDANVAALGEKWLGAGRDYDSMCMLTLGTGVGGAIVLNRRIWHGMTGMAGELGHITIDPHGPPCGCGNNGCLEQYASATAIKRMAGEAMARGNAAELGRALDEHSEFSSKLVHQMAAAGDPAAQAVFDRVGEALGIALAALVNIFNFPVYVVGGGVSAGWDAFAPAMLRQIAQRSFVFRAATARRSTGHRRTIITRALLGSDAGLMGAARLALEASGPKSC